jgi:hypothetical protein
MTPFAPTAEQSRALDLFATGGSLAVEAGAGTGKTATLLMLAQSCPDRRGQYVAFNKAIVGEAGEKFPATVACNTAHSLAFRVTGKRYQHRLRSAARMKSSDIANLIRVDPVTLHDTPAGRKHLGRPYLAGLAMRAVTRFCQSADPEPTWRHVPHMDGIDAVLPDGRRGTANNREVAKSIEPAVRRAWADLTAENGSLPFKHDVYLKLAHLEEMRIGADYILFDEAQDANPVLVAIIQAQDHAQIVWVGDSQQAIYGFTGAVNALAGIAADQRTFLTQSFRFGPAVADEANTILSWIDGADLRLTGLDSIPSTVGPVTSPDVILTRTNATAVRELLTALQAGRRPHLVGGAREIVAVAEAAAELMRGQRTGHPELACFESWGEVQDYVALDEQGDELRLLVNLIDEFGVGKIREALGGMPSEQHADLVVSTAHKAKGREWGSVKIAADFPEDRGKLGDEEKRLLYVAVTRAKLALDITAVDVLSPDYDSPEQAAAREEQAARRAQAQAAAERRQADRATDAPAASQADPEEAELREGRYEVVGEIVSTKETYGRRNMLVRVDGGECRVYGTIPAGLNGVQRGDRVRFTATVERSDTDDTFGFFSRPADAAQVTA